LEHFGWEKPQKQSAMVLHPELSGKLSDRNADARLDEAVGLSLAINLDIAYKEVVNIRDIKPSTYIGQGAIERLAEIIENSEINVVVFDTQLTPVQQRNLEKKLNAKVIDRTALILEIFGERARTREGSLQVELAHLNYQRSRLVRSWTHLERQRGALGFIGGPGETQIEIDRRLISERISKIKKELEKVVKTRELHRSARKRVPYPIVALVGYTNAGKSTLFNKLTDSDVFAQDLLFATLDPTMRKVELPSGKEIILSDTVGFISDLPHELVAAFRATLEEVLDADIVVHVRDISHEDTISQKEDVYDVLENLGLEKLIESDQIVELCNKTDLLSKDDLSSLKHVLLRKENSMPISALNGDGINEFLDYIDERLSRNEKTVDLIIPNKEGKAIAWVYEFTDVLSSSNFDDDNMIFQVKINSEYIAKLENKFPFIKLKVY
jgi:GTP-binding protein HflX